MTQPKGPLLFDQFGKLIARHFSNDASTISNSRDFLDSLIENMPNMVFVKDAKNLRYVRFNRAGEELLGYSRSELIGKSDFDFFPKEQASRFVADDRAVLNGHSIVEIAEEKIRTKYKGERILHTKKIPLFDDFGAPAYLLGISEDITEKKKAEDDRLKLAREQAALNARRKESQIDAILAEASQHLASSFDYRETLNKVANLLVPLLCDWCSFTVIKPDRSLDRVAVAHKDPEKAAAVEAILKYDPPRRDSRLTTAEVIRTGKSSINEAFTEATLKQKSNGDINYVNLVKKLGIVSNIVVPMVARGRVLGAISFVSTDARRSFDNQDLAAAEELGRRAGIAIDNGALYTRAQEAIKIREDFLSIASHELKTPLTSLYLQLQMLYRASDKTDTGLETATRRAGQLGLLIENLLDVGRLRNGRLDLNLQRVHLDELLREVVDSFSEFAKNNNVSISINECPETIGMWDKLKINQAITNLISNSIKYGNSKPVEVSIRHGKNRVYLVVKDNGIGIDLKDHHRIFDKFERAISPNEVSGLGLGLYITRQIAEAHGGTVHIESEIGKGSKFTLELATSVEPLSNSPL